MNFKKGEIDADLQSDLLTAVKCGFDQLLKYFLYRVLKEDCDEKIEIDNLQAKIESLQSARYYPKIQDTEDDRTSKNDSGKSPTSARVYEKARLEEVTDDHRNGTPAEQEKVERREVITNDLLKDGLKEVLTVANNQEIRQLLQNFAAGYKGNDVNRQGPFVELCNGILDLLKTTTLHLPVRSLDHGSINIRFQVNDRAHTSSHFQGYKTPVGCSPDFFISSEAALFHHSGQANVDTNGFPNSLTWPIVLSAGRFEVHNLEHPEGVWRVEKPDLYAYAFVDELVIETGPTMLHEIDTILEEAVNTTHVQAHSGSKRSHGVALGHDEGLPQAKRVHMPTTTSSGTATITDPKSAASEASEFVDGALEDYQDQNVINGRARCASYALEMLSYSAGVHHAINLLLTDGILWLCYHDRQGIIQSTGISIIHDLPRFIVLLLAFQRFSLQDWGIISSLNPEAKTEHTRRLPNDGFSGGKFERNGVHEAAHEDQEDDMRNDPAPFARINLEEDLEASKDFSLFWRGRRECNIAKLSHVELKMKEYLSERPHCLTGRATGVVLATGQGGEGKIDMVCKVYYPEAQHRHGGLMMEVIYDIAVKGESQAQYKSEGANIARMNMLDHLPHFYFFGDVKDTTTHRIRSMVNRKWKGHRKMRIIGMKKLEEVTTLSGWDFVKAWLEGVICHAFLWKNHVEHGDPSVSNLMYDPEGKCGVLTDFDLSLLQWEPRVVGTDRTGTVPFMALDLLDKDYWKGLTKRYYHHELESFIWMLPYVFLQYKEGRRHYNELVDPWITSNIDTCRKEKGDFYQTRLDKAQSMVQSGYSQCWSLARTLCQALYQQRFGVRARRMASESQTQIAGQKPDYVLDSEHLWDRVFLSLTQQLRNVESVDFEALLTWFGHHKPGFILSDEDAKSLHKSYSAILNSSQPL